MLCCVVLCCVVSVAQWCPALYGPVDRSTPGSSVRAILREECRIRRRSHSESMSPDDTAADGELRRDGTTQTQPGHVKARGDVSRRKLAPGGAAQESRQPSTDSEALTTGTRRKMEALYRGETPDHPRLQSQHRA